MPAAQELYAKSVRYTRRPTSARADPEIGMKKSALSAPRERIKPPRFQRHDEDS